MRHPQQAHAFDRLRQDAAKQVCANEKAPKDVRTFARTGSAMVEIAHVGYMWEVVRTPMKAMLGHIKIAVFADGDGRPCVSTYSA